MEQPTFANFVQGLTLELRNVACSLTNTLIGESFLKHIQLLVHREDGGYRAWMEEMRRYFKIVHVGDEDKCQAALLTTKGSVGQFVYGLMANNVRSTWDELKRSLDDYYGVVANPNARIVELANVEQGRTEEIQDYMQTVVRLAEGAHMGIDGGNQVVAKQVLGFNVI